MPSTLPYRYQKVRLVLFQVLTNGAAWLRLGGTIGTSSSERRMQPTRTRTRQGIPGRGYVLDFAGGGLRRFPVFFFPFSSLLFCQFSGLADLFFEFVFFFLSSRGGILFAVWRLKGRGNTGLCDRALSTPSNPVGTGNQGIWRY